MLVTDQVLYFERLTLYFSKILFVLVPYATGADIAWHYEKVAILVVAWPLRELNLPHKDLTLQQLLHLDPRIDDPYHVVHEQDGMAEMILELHNVRNHCLDSCVLVRVQGPVNRALILKLHLVFDLLGSLVHRKSFDG